MPLTKLFTSIPVRKCINYNWRLLSNVTSSRKVDNVINQMNSLNIKEKSDPPLKNKFNLLFSPNTISSNYEIGQRRPSIMEIPLRPTLNEIIIERKTPMIDTPSIENAFECPTISDIPEKHAIRMIVIRRRKMRVHKLKKLRKRMKFAWAKINKNKKIKKEKDFQNMLLAKVKDAEKFSAEAYINENYRKMKEKPILRMIKGKRMPLFIVRQYLGLDPKINYKQIK